MSRGEFNSGSSVCFVSCVKIQFTSPDAMLL